jgi:la-related protein 1
MHAAAQAYALEANAVKPLDEDARGRIRTQIEFYFSVDNLCKDMYLRSHMDTDGWTPLELIMQFPKVKKFCAATDDVLATLEQSTTLDVDKARKLIRLRDEEQRAKWCKVPGRDTAPTSPKAATG